MARFYSQPIEYWLDQDVVIVNEALEAMVKIEAQDDLRLISIACFPDLKKESREKMIKELRKKADPESMKPRVVTSTDLARLLGRGP